MNFIWHTRITINSHSYRLHCSHSSAISQQLLDFLFDFIFFLFRLHGMDVSRIILFCTRASWCSFPNHWLCLESSQFLVIPSLHWGREDNTKRISNFIIYSNSEHIHFNQSSILLFEISIPLSNIPMKCRISFDRQYCIQLDWCTSAKSISHKNNNHPFIAIFTLMLRADGDVFCCQWRQRQHHIPHGVSGRKT